MFKNILRGVKSHRCKVISLAIKNIFQELVVYYMWGGASILRKLRRFSNQPPQFILLAFWKLPPINFAYFESDSNPNILATNCALVLHILYLQLFLWDQCLLFTAVAFKFWFKLGTAQYPLCNAPTGDKQQASQMAMWPIWWINLDCFSYDLVLSWQVEQGCIKLTLLL